MSSSVAWKPATLQTIFQHSSRVRQVQVSPQKFQQICRSRRPLPCSRSFATTAEKRGTVSTAIKGSQNTTLDNFESATTERFAEVREAAPVIEEYAIEETRNAEERERCIKRIKKLMRTVINPVAIVTTSEPGKDSYEAKVYGATISSFHTVSFNPVPIISLNLRADSVTLKTILASGKLTLSFPTNDVLGKTLAQAFTTGNFPSPFVSQGGMIVGQSWFKAAKNCPPAVHVRSPKSRSSNSGLAFAFTCNLEGSLKAGDHFVLTASLAPVPPLITENYPIIHHDSDVPYFTVFQSLAYVHGIYTDRNDSRIARPPGVLGRLEEPIRFDSEITWISINRLRSTIAHYRQRIELIDRAVEMRKHVEGKSIAEIMDARNDLILHISDAELAMIQTSHRERLKNCLAELRRRHHYLFVTDRGVNVSTLTPHDDLSQLELSKIIQLVSQTEQEILELEEQVQRAYRTLEREGDKHAETQLASMLARSPTEINLIFKEVKALKAKGVIDVKIKSPVGRDIPSDESVKYTSDIRDASESDDVVRTPSSDLDVMPRRPRPRFPKPGYEHKLQVYESAQVHDKKDEINSEIPGLQQHTSAKAVPPAPPQLDRRPALRESRARHVRAVRDPPPSEVDMMVLDLGEGDIRLDPNDLFVLKRPGEKQRIDQKLKEVMSENAKAEDQNISAKG